MKIKDLCKEKDYEINIFELSAAKLCLADENRIQKLINDANEAISKLLELKKSFKKIECNLPENCDFTLYEINLSTGATSLNSKIEYKVSKNFMCKLYLSIRLYESLENIKKYKEIEKIRPLYKLVKYFNIEEDSCPKSRILHEDFIYTINRLVNFLEESIKALKKNIEFLNKEVC